MNNLIKFMLFVMVFTMSLGMFSPVYAANVAVNLGVGGKVPTLDTTYPIDNQASAELALSTAAEVYLQYATSASQYATADTVVILASAPLTMSACASPTTDADQDGLVDGAAVIVAADDTYTYTFTQATTAATSSVTFCIAIAGVATAGNYSFIMADSKGAGVEDYGAAIVYIGTSANLANDVYVTATVQGQELDFLIRNAADTASTYTCPLGTLTTSLVSSCEYRLKVRTTATDGYTISWTSDGGLDKGGTATIDAVAVGTDVVAGAENYGANLTEGANTDGGTCAGQGIWAGATDDPVSTTPQSLILCSNANLPGATDLTNTHVMKHSASINPATPAGNYDQIVTYYVTANF